MEALRDLADDFNVRDPRKLYRLARQRDLDVTQAMAFEALKADVGRQVQAPRALGKSAAEGPNDRLQADLIDFSQNTRGKTKYGLVVMDVFTREAAVEPLQNKNAETVGRATKRAAQELTGDDGNFVVTTDLGNEFATLDRELSAEAVRRAKRPEDRNAIAVVDRGIQTLKKDLATRVARKGGRPGPTTRGPTRRCTARPRTWRSSRPRSSGSSKTTPTSSTPSERRRTRRGASTLSTARGKAGVRELSFRDFLEIPVHHLFRPPPSQTLAETTYTFLLQTILLTLWEPCFRSA